MNMCVAKSVFALLFVSLAYAADGSYVDSILNADYEELESPLFESGRATFPVYISADLVYSWSLPNGQEVILAEGNFNLKSEGRTLTSDYGVVWIKGYDKDPARLCLDIYAEGNVLLKEKGGSSIKDRRLFITIYTRGRIHLVATSLAREDMSSSALYLKANSIRMGSYQERHKYAVSSGDRVVIHPPVDRSSVGKRTDKAAVRDHSAERKLRRPITIKGNFSFGPYLKETSEQVLIGYGGVYLIQGAVSEDDQPVEFYATNAVLFIKSDRDLSVNKDVGKGNVADNIDSDVSKDKGEGKYKPNDVADTTGFSQDGPAREGVNKLEEILQEYPTEEEKIRKTPEFFKIRENQYVSSAYFEGDVVITKGYRTIRADKVFYDFDNSTALVLDVVARTLIPERNLPIYVRAEELRQLDDRSYIAKNAKITTNSFYTPSYHIGATKIYFEDRTIRTPTGEQIGLVAGSYKMHNVTLNVGGVPLLYWPYLAGRFKEGESALKSVSGFYDSDFGLSGRTSWRLFQLLGIEEPDGVDTTLRLDYYGKRGPAVGIDVDYEQDRYFGLLRSYYVYDTGEDNLGGDLRGEVKPPYRNRGRFLIRHKHFLPDDWELNLELSYISDRHFLEEYFEDEWEEDKEQETVIYLKKLFGDIAFSILGKWRINDFLTQTEKLPDIAIDVLGRPLFDSRIIWYSENHIGAVRRRIDKGFPTELPYYDQSIWWLLQPTNYVTDSQVVFRTDMREEFQIPFDIGPLRVVPFAVIRASIWDDSIEGGGLTRLFAMYGLSASMYQWKVYNNVKSRLLDLNMLRHIMKEDITIWASHTNQPSWKLYAFDPGIETIDEIDGVSVGWRHRFQTKRMSSVGWKSVDWLTVDLEAGFFNDKTEYAGQNRTRGTTIFYRPELSVASNYISAKVDFQISSTSLLSYEAIVDTDDGRMGRSYFGLQVSRIPQLIWSIGHEYIGLTESNLFTFTATYKLNKKYIFLVNEEFDIDRGENADLEVGFVRKMPGWYIAITAGFDETAGVDSVNFAIWPAGIPEWTLGLKRYPRMLRPLVD